jgi:hypothetical protein
MAGGGKRPGAGRKPGSPNKVSLELRELAQAYAPAALAELARLAKSAKSETARVAAIRELLDRGYGKSRQTVASEFEGRSVTFSIHGMAP